MKSALPLALATVPSSLAGVVRLLGPAAPAVGGLPGRALLAGATGPGRAVAEHALARLLSRLDVRHGRRLQLLDESVAGAFEQLVHLRSQLIVVGVAVEGCEVELRAERIDEPPDELPERSLFAVVDGHLVDAQDGLERRVVLGRCHRSVIALVGAQIDADDFDGGRHSVTQNRVLEHLVPVDGRFADLLGPLFCGAHLEYPFLDA
jgi:hypothetical protein